MPKSSAWDLGTSEMITGRSLQFPLVTVLENRSHGGSVTLLLVSSTRYI